MKYLIIILGIVASTQAQALCRSSWVCNADGSCSTQDVCDSTMDMPSMNITPINPNTTYGTQPVQPAVVPPMGTTQCTMQMVDGFLQNICQ